MITDFDINLGELATAFSIIIASIIVARISDFIVENFVKKHAERTESDIDDKIIRILKGPIYYIIILIGLMLALKQLSIPVEYTQIVNKFIVVLIIIISSWVVAGIVQILLYTFGKKLARRPKSTIDVEAIPFLSKIAYFLVYIIAFMIILSHLGIDITPLTALGAVAGFALGFAAQESISNILAGFFILADRPFKKGDRIQMGDYLGEVLDIGLRSTKIETLDHTLVIIPNSKLITNEVTNYALPNLQIKVRIPFGVAYGSEISKVKKIAMGVAEKSNVVLDDPQPDIYFMEFGDSSLNFMLIVWVDNFRDKFRVTDEMNSKLYDEFNKARVEIPFPCRTVYIEKQ